MSGGCAHVAQIWCSAVYAPRSHSLRWVGSGDRSLLFEQYDFKLWSYEDRLARFCLAVLPSLIGMALLLVAYKALSLLRSVL